MYRDGEEQGRKTGAIDTRDAAKAPVVHRDLLDRPVQQISPLRKAPMAPGSPADFTGFCLQEVLLIDLWYTITIMYVPLDSYKEKQVPDASQTRGEIWISKFTKLMGEPKFQSRIILSKTQSKKLSENKHKKKIFKAAKK